MGETTPSRVLYRVRGARLLLLPAFAMLLAAPASARILNVPSDYPDIRAAVGVAVSGDSIQVAPGTYVGGAFVHDEALTIGSRYMTTGDTSFVSQTVLDGVSSSSCGGAAGCAGNSVLEFGDNAHGSAVIGLTISNGENGIGSLASIVDVLHCRVVSNGDGLDYSTGSGGTFSNNLIENNSDDGIDLNGKMNVNVVNNIIRNNGDDGIEFRLYAFAGGGTASATFSFNRIYGNGEDGIQFIDYPAVSAYTLQVDHNIFTANFDAGGSSAGIGITPNGDTIEGLVGAPMAERLYVLHNTFIGEKNGLVGGANVIALDNIFANTQGSAVRHVSGSSIVSYGMFWNNGIDYETSVVDAPHLLHVNPLLNTDGTLGAGSPAIDAGAAFYQWNGETVLNEPPGSYTGTAPDLGAVEFGSTLNQPPVVSVSASLTVTLPAQAPLGGTVTDDGRPAPPSLKFAWSVVSGSGPMAIQEPDQLQTRASFSLPGTYVVRLTVSDGALSSSDVVSITVLPSPNTAPLVNAGPDQTITLPADAALHGTASDDRLPNPPGTVSVVWMKNSGPGTVTFQNVNAADTRASFTSAGVYVLILIASDGALTARDTTRVTVLVDPNRAPAVNAGLDQTIILSAGATLVGTVTDDGLPNPPASVTIAWSKGSGPGTVTLGTPGATTTSATFSATGTYVLRLTANDGALATTDSVQIVAQTQPVPIERRVAAASDDTEEETTSGSISGNTSDIELVTGATPQIDGLRFTNITVARGTTIASAYIQFEADEAQSEVTNLVFQGHAADNAPTFTTAIHDVSARPRTAASVNWSPVAWAVVGEQGTNQRTGDLKAIVQEIVNRPGWVSGNAIAILVSGTGHRTARAFESVPAGAALLHIETGAGPPGNAAPLVDAGFNQTITLPATAGLAGSVSDDGLPNSPGVTTVSWSKGSGPGTVSFLNPNAVSTSASFSTSGTYVLRLTANDGALTTTDSVQITVLPVPNSAPLVDAGPNQTITLPASATLSGSVSDDGKPNPPGAVTVTWTKGSGPGTVSFANANAVSTTATFSLVGTYILRLTASDGSLTTKDSLQVTVLPHNFPPTANAGADQAIVLPANASLAGSASDDGLPNPPGVLTTTWSSVSGPGPVTFQNASQPSTSASFTAPGVYLLRLNASDGSLSRADTVQITVLQGAVALERRIATGTDDAEESATGSMNHTSVNLQLVFNSTNQIDGLRFAAVTVPKFAVILTAYVQFTANIIESGACSLVIQGQAADNAATFAGTSFNVSSRPRTADSVTWVPPPWTTVGAAGANQRTPELKTILQGIVNRSGWVSGNALVLIVHGTGVRTAYSYDGSAAQAALLHVEYATTGPALAAAADSSGTPDDPVPSVTRGGHAAASVEHAVAQRVESAPPELGLRSIGAIPARGAPVVECALPDDAPATLEVHDIAGRRIASRELGSLGAGRHLIALEGRLPAGVYIVRLTQAGRARIVKLAILP